MSGSFTRAMGAGQPQMQPPQQGGQPQGAPPAVGQQLQQAQQMIQHLLAQLARVPGVDQATFQQGVALLKLGTETIAKAMPQGGQGQQPPAA